jgi:uncharacterized lipoprotein YddW (UPF0748 family)/outer membrane protein assembly factor BamB
VAPAARGQEFRAYWVDYANAGIRTQSEINTLIANVKAAHMNSIIAQVRPRGDAFYISGYEPRSEYLLAGSPADPLRLLLNAAHAASPRIEVHAWVNAEKSWSKGTGANPILPASPYHPFRLFPEFRNLDDLGNNYASGDGFFFDPGNPRQLDYNTKVYEDLARRYPDLDGIHYDFVRYATLNWGFTPTALARYGARTGLVPRQTDGQWTTPASNWSTGLDPTFAQWRRDQVTGFVRETYARVYKINPNIKISGSLICITGPPTSLTDAAWYVTDPAKYRYQNWYQWLKEGILDEGVGMAYKQASDDASFRGWARLLGSVASGGVSLGITGQGNYLNTVPANITQLKEARAEGSAGHATYSYASPSQAGERTRWAAALTVDNADNGYDAPFPTDAAPPSAPWKLANGLLTGRVTDTLTGAPALPATNPGPSSYANLAGVSVRIAAGPAGTVGRSVAPNSMGTYVFVDLPPGDYTVQTTVPAGLPYTGAGASGTVEAAKETTMDLPLTPTAAAAAAEVDDSTGASAASSFYSQTGTWAAGTSPELGYLNTYRAAAPYTGGVAATASWTPFVPAAGTYRVYARWAQGTNRTSAAVYQAITGTETVDFPAVDQRSGGGQWNLLGTAYFHLGRAGRITLSASAGGYAVADAVRLERETPEFWPATTYTVPRAALSDPVSDGSSVYFGSADGHLYAYNMTEDRPLWRYPTSETGLGAAVGRPAVSDGIVFFGTSAGQVRAVRTLPPSGSYLEQPQMLWTSSAVGGGVSGSPSVLDSVVYVGGGDGRVYALNGSLGVVDGVAPGGLLYRSEALGARVTSTAAVLANGGVWVETEDGRVARLSLDLASVRWQSDGGAGTDASVYTDGRTVFAASPDGRVTAYNAANGRTEWETTLAAGNSASTPMGDGDGTLYVMTSDNRLWGLDAETGAARPGYEAGRALPPMAAPGAPLVAPTAGSPDIYIPGADRFTAVSGAEARQHDLARALGSHGPGRFHAPALCGDFVVATNDNGQLIGWRRPAE